MANYDFTACLSPLDFEILSKDLLEAEFGIELENFGEGRDRGIDLRYAPVRGTGRSVFNLATMGFHQKAPELIVQCKRHARFSNLKSEIKNKEFAKIARLNPARYILTTSVSLSPQQADEIKTLLSPFVQGTGDIFGRERLNSLLTKHPEIERRQIKLWVTSAGVLDSIINAGTHAVSREEVERTIAAAKIYVRNESFDEALAILKQHHVCIISGLPGIGKTMLARMLLLYFYNREFDVVKITNDVSEARAVGYHSKPRFFYYDDFLGQTAQADKLNKNEDQRLIDFMTSVRNSKDSVLVLTTREYILNQAKLHYEKLARERFDHRTCIIDLSKYSRRIRAQILYNHLHFSNLPKPLLDAVVSKRGYLEIVDHRNYNPRLIEYLTDSAWVGDILPTEYLAAFLQKLDNPVDIWEHAFRHQLSERSRHLLFVLTTMPVESLLDDLERAFAFFSRSQGAGFRDSTSSADFRSALKELDGTFVTTRKVEAFILVRLQNPSIRDFMQNLLLRGELLTELLENLVFFEQAQWFLETMTEEDPPVEREVLRNNRVKIFEALKNLARAPSCSLSVGRDTERLCLHRVNPAARLATTASSIDKTNKNEHDWMGASMVQFTSDISEGDVSADWVIGAIGVLKKLGWLRSSAGRRLIFALKSSVLDEPSALHEFETLARVADSFPQFFDETELATARSAYSEFIENELSPRDFNDPEELRSEALRIADTGDLLEVDTDAAQKKFSEAADQMEQEEGQTWDDDDGCRSSAHDDECPDSELDSMFGTL